MHQTVDIPELALVITARNHNPTLLNFDFLRYSGIVPTDWKLTRPAVCTERVAQIFFHNGISLVAQPERIIFSEVLGAKAPQEVSIPEIARKYVETLPNLDYQAIGINLIGSVPVNGESEA